MFETSFGAVEKALLQSHRIPDSLAGAFRGRITSLQKHDLFGPKRRPGRGVALTYSFDQFHRLIFACELLEFGVSPAPILWLVESLWERKLRKIFEDAEQPAKDHEKPGADDIIMHMGGIHLLTDVWRNAVPNVNRCRLRDLPVYVMEWMEMGPDDPMPPRAMLVNVSQRLRNFYRALRQEHTAGLAKDAGEIEKATGRGSRIRGRKGKRT